MKIKNLFIIGKGFDLDHGFKTSYKAFGDFHGDVHADVLFPRGHENNWNDAENYFKEFFHDDVKRTILSCENHSEAELINIWKEFKAKFITWITGENSKIKKSSDKNKYNFNGYENAHYINFNYTSTLQNIYGIDEANVTHIHGAVDLKYDLIFGADANSKRDREIQNDFINSTTTNNQSTQNILNEINNETEEKFKSALYELHYTSFSKHSEKNINDKLHPLDLSEVENIYILGHSLNDLDSSYFGYIFRAVKKPFKVKCSFHKKNEKEKELNLKKLTGICESRANMMKLKDSKERFDRVYSLEKSDAEMMKMEDILIVRAEKEVDLKMNTA